MSGGFGAGFIKGALLSLAVASAVSLVLPLPDVSPVRKTQTKIETPAGSGFGAARRDTVPVLPETDQTVKKKPVRQPSPRVEAPASPLAADTTSAVRPRVPVTPVGQGLSQAQVAQGDSGPSLPAPVDEASPRVSLPSLGGAPTGDTPVSERPTRPANPVSPPATSVEAPRMVAGADTSPAVGAAGNGAPTDKTTGQDSLPPALERNAVPYSNPDHKPMLSVILIDAGDKGLSTDVLRSFDFPVTFALDPDLDGATAKAKLLYRGGRFEIMALAPARLGVPGSNADPASVLEDALVSLPETVALLERPEHSLTQVKGLADRILPVLKGRGVGLVAYDRADDSAFGRARRAGVPVGAVYRLLDGERESGIVIKRYLSRAAIEATRRGRVIVVGHSYPETVTALFSWAISEKPADVVLAPISAVLQQK